MMQLDLISLKYGKISRDIYAYLKYIMAAKLWRV